MDEQGIDIIDQNPKEDSGAPQQDNKQQQDPEQSSGNIFDISDDLTISPISEETLKGIPPASSIPTTPVTPVIQSKPSQVQPPKPHIPPNGNPDLKPLRTYEGDVAEVMSHRRTSTASMVIAENAKKEAQGKIANKPAEKEERGASHALKGILLTLISFILLGGGTYAAYYLYSLSPIASSSTAPTQPPQPQQQVSNSLVPVDSTAIIAIDGLNQTQILSKIRAEVSKPLAPGSIKEIVIAKTVNGSLVRVPSADMISLMNINAPDMLARSLSPEWMLGVYADDSGDMQPFVIITNSFFQNAFAGMLSWETSMPTDLRLYLPDTASTTSILTQGRFQDRLVKNKDVREFVTDNGSSFLYSFIDTNRLVIASNESVLSEIIDRLEKQAFVR